MSADTDAPPADEVEEAPRDEVREGVLERITAELGDAVVESHIAPGVGLWVRVAPEAWRTAGLVARDHLDCRWFDFLSAIDWMPSPYGRYEDDGLTPPADPDTEIVTGYAGGDTRFQVLAHVVDVVGQTDVFLKADLADDDAPTIDSWVPLYDGADWHEREAWEMFGITFTGHPGLRHIYLPGDFEGYPLRKDFPLLARIVKPWPGIVDVEPMPAQDDEEGGEAAEGGDGA